MTVLKRAHDGNYHFLVNFSAKNLFHSRMIRPAGQGGTCLK